MNNLAACYGDDEQFDRAEPLFTECLLGRRRVLGADHPDTRVTANNLGLLKKAMGQTAEAALFFRESAGGSLANKSAWKVCVCAVA